MNRRIALAGALVGSLLMVSSLMAEENVYKKALKSTVWVVQRDGNRMRSGSGSLIDARPAHSHELSCRAKQPRRDNFLPGV